MQTQYFAKPIYLFTSFQGEHRNVKNPASAAQVDKDNEVHLSAENAVRIQSHDRRRRTETGAILRGSFCLC